MKNQKENPQRDQAQGTQQNAAMRQGQDQSHQQKENQKQNNQQGETKTSVGQGAQANVSQQSQSKGNQSGEESTLRSGGREQVQGNLDQGNSKNQNNAQPDQSPKGPTASHNEEAEENLEDLSLQNRDDASEEGKD